jgi:hypothetical protein
MGYVTADSAGFTLSLGDDVPAMEVALQLVACLVNEYGAVVTAVDVKGAEDGSFTIRLPKLASQSC